MRRSPTVLAVTFLLVGCTSTAPHVDRARDRLEEAQDLLEARDGGQFTYVFRVDEPNHDPVGYCGVQTIEPSSVAADRFELMLGSPTDVGPSPCAVGDWFLVDGDTVYAPDRGDDHRWTTYRWAVVAEDVLAEIEGQVVDDVRYSDILDYAWDVTEEDEEMTLRLDAEAISELADDDIDVSGGYAVFSFDDEGALAEARYTFSGPDGMTVEIHHLFEDLGEPQGIVLPAADELEEESPTITTSDQLAAFVGIG